MDFSVVIPLYNKAPHVAEALQSALDQSLAPREIIVVDDGSTDGSKEIVERFGDPRVQLLTRSPPGPGGYAARNLGSETAAGDWVAFLDADDYWHADHLQSLADAVGRAGEGVGGAFSRMEVVRGDQRALLAVSERYLRPGRANSFADMLRAWLDAERCPVWTSASAFRRDVLLRAGLFPSGRTLRGGDKDLWLRAMAIAPMAYSPAITGGFREDAVNRVSDSTSHNDLPLIALTIRELLAGQQPPITDLLKQISNHEIGLYAKHSAGRGRPVGLTFFQALYLPSGLGSAIQMLTWSTLGVFLRAFRHRRR